MPTRRNFVRLAATLPALFPLLGCEATEQYTKSISSTNASPDGHETSDQGEATNVGDQPMNRDWFMPDEGEPHARTWMSFGASERVWGKRLIDAVRRNIATVAQAIARFEPVTICVREKDRAVAKSYFTDLHNIEWMVCSLDDMWIRDYGAVFVINERGHKAAVNFNFNGWGEKQDFENDAEVSELMAKASKVKLLETELCLEGGGIEVDGHGTAIITESCVLNANRNPRWKKSDVEAELLELLGIEKVIWLPGVRAADITDGHTDFYARFVKPGVVVAHFDPDTESPEHELTQRHRKILETATDAKGDRLKVVMLEAPSTVRDEFKSDDFCAGYINFYVCNGAVIAPEFSDKKTDAAAKEKLGELFAGREIVMLNIDGIAAGGGGIHCATQQEPKV